MQAWGQESPGNGPTPAPKPVDRSNDMMNPLRSEALPSCPGNQEQALEPTSPIGPNMDAGALSHLAGNFNYVEE